MLPSYVTIDPKSQWHVSGLLCTAVESMTLPSRLKARDGTRETLDQIASALNVNGNQNIAKLRMSVAQKSAAVLNGQGNDWPGRLEVGPQSRDTRIPPREGLTDAPQITDEDGVATFDMDFFFTEETEQVQSRQRQNMKKVHVFGQAENYRDEEDGTRAQTNDAKDDGREKARRRAAGLPVIQKSVQVFLRSRFPVGPHFVFHACFSQNPKFLGFAQFVLLMHLQITDTPAISFARQLPPHIRSNEPFLAVSISKDLFDHGYDSRLEDTESTAYG